MVERQIFLEKAVQSCRSWSGSNKLGKGLRGRWSGVAAQIRVAIETGYLDMVPYGKCQWVHLVVHEHLRDSEKVGKDLGFILLHCVCQMVFAGYE